MYRYKSENELDTFNFHDHVIIEARVKGNTLVWIFSSIDVSSDNGSNPFDDAMLTDQAVVNFEDCSYSNIEKDFSVNGKTICENVADTRLKHINQMITKIPFSFGGEKEKKRAVFETMHGDHIMTFCVNYSRVTVEWNEFIHKGFGRRKDK